MAVDFVTRVYRYQLANPLEPSPLMQTPTDVDGPTGLSNACGMETRKTVQTHGPYSLVEGANVFDGITYHSVEFAIPYSKGQSCAVWTSTHRWLGVDPATGDNDSWREGEGVVCAHWVSGPEMTIEPLTVRAGSVNTPMRVRIMASGKPVPDMFARLSIDPAAPVRGRLYCDSYTNAEGYLGCSYTAPKTMTVEKVTGECAECLQPAKSTITVTKPMVVGFFNGVWNTDYQASDGLKALKELIGLKYEGTDLRYENFYNQTGSGNGNTALQDIAEVFIQRGKELDGVLNNRWEHYWELLAGKHAEGDSLTARLLNGLGNGASALAGLLDATFSATLAQIFSGYSQMLSNPPTAADVAAQLQKLRSLADEDHSFVLIAHSQGNLFVNSAYDGLRGSHPDTKAGVVHVAPASPTLRGEHLLADIDLVINGLRIQGINAVASNNISLPASKSDLSGHTLVGTYLDATRAAREKINGMVQAVLGKL
ncbi:hypothetical protein VAR608DRAFT_3389 [Variovorax sp. HW608]|nr:hypothetical protein VAR608DRAFT_3389 [Variovorax sp. HW608]